MPDATCKTCPWWEETQGQCRRRSPSVFQEELVVGQYGERRFDYYLMFPSTSADDWCGEHPQRKAAQQKEVPHA